jgi:hypothetical protein
MEQVFKIFTYYIIRHYLILHILHIFNIICHYNQNLKVTLHL